jgi:hypothetical protein
LVNCIFPKRYTFPPKKKTCKKFLYLFC